MNKSVLGACLLASVLLLACDKSSNSKKIIRNSSAKSIKVLVFEKPYSGKERKSYIIKANSEAIVENFTSKSGPMYATSENCIFPKSDSVAIVVPTDNNLRITKDLTNSNSWVFSKKSSSKGIDVECKATITDSDIAPK